VRTLRLGTILLAAILAAAGCTGGGGGGGGDQPAARPASAASGADRSSLKGVCPDTIVVQTDWNPETGYGCSTT
jgi:ABC-type glycerol-3-phosphate transport system substrate-binding protein